MLRNSSAIVFTLALASLLIAQLFGSVYHEKSFSKAGFCFVAAFVMVTAIQMLAEMRIHSIVFDSQGCYIEDFGNSEFIPKAHVAEIRSHPQVNNHSTLEIRVACRRGVQIHTIACEGFDSDVRENLCRLGFEVQSSDEQSNR